MRNGEKRNSNKRKEHIFSLITLIGILLIITASLFGIAVANTNYLNITQEWQSILHDLSVGLLVVGLLGFFDRYVSKKSFLLQTQKSIEDVFERTLPERLVNLRDMGVRECTMGFNTEDFIFHLKSAQNCQIIINTIWIPDIHKISDGLIDAVNDRNCHIRVLMLDPDQGTEAINKRASSLKYSVKTIKEKINHTLEVLNEAVLELDDPSKLEVKLHNSFISSSILGIGETLWVGFYLDGRIATKGLHLKIKGSEKPFFQDILKHFRIAWGKGPNASPIQ